MSQFLKKKFLFDSAKDFFADGHLQFGKISEFFRPLVALAVWFRVLPANVYVAFTMNIHIT
jgi:hypothetical protein